ncbi:hypothetical protein DFJ73DRAFT_846981 [Zopfochytrium polystomum]|nr:hypothetical protein DFJ73DRAFT_846981 [Zopfochytrium polystomum]
MIPRRKSTLFGVGATSTTTTTTPSSSTPPSTSTSTSSSSSSSSYPSAVAKPSQALLESYETWLNVFRQSVAADTDATTGTVGPSNQPVQPVFAAATTDLAACLSGELRDGSAHRSFILAYWSDTILDEILAPLDDLPPDDIRGRQRLLWVLHQLFVGALWATAEGHQQLKEEARADDGTVFDACWARLLAGLLSDGGEELGGQVDVLVKEIVLGSLRGATPEAQRRIIDAIFTTYVGLFSTDPTRSSSARIERILTEAATGRGKLLLQSAAGWMKIPRLRPYALLLLSGLVGKKAFAEDDLSSADECGFIDGLLLLTRFDSAIATVPIAARLLAIFLPRICWHFSVTRFDSVVSSLLRCLRWETAACFALRSPIKVGADISYDAAVEDEIEMEDMESISRSFLSPASEVSARSVDGAVAPDAEELSKQAMIVSIRSAFSLLYTVVYGLVPCLLLQRSRAFIKAAKSHGSGWRGDDKDDGLPADLGGGKLTDLTFAITPDQLLEDFQSSSSHIFEVVDFGSFVSKRLEALMKSHSTHSNLVYFAAPMEEIEALLASRERDAASIMEMCLSLRISRPRPPRPSASSTPVISPGEVVSTDGFLSTAIRFNHVLRTKLYSGLSEFENKLLPASAAASSPETPAAYQSRFLLFLSELNVELCLRVQQRQVISSLKKSRIMDDIRSAEMDTLFDRVRQQQAELAAAAATIERLKNEAAITRERHHRYEEDLLKKARSARETARTATAEAEEVRSQFEQLQSEIAALRTTVNERDGLLSELKREVDALRPLAATATERAEAVKSLTDQLLKRETEGDAHSASRFSSRLLDANLKLENQSAEISRLSKEVESLKSQLLLNDMTSVVEQQTKTIENLQRLVNLSRQENERRLVAVEAKCRTLRQVNLSLQARLLGAGDEDAT